MAARSLRALLTNSIDYAGLFPPASLDLEPALADYASYLCASDSWMLASFVLPGSKFAEAAWFISAFDDSHPLAISALGPKTSNQTDFLEELRTVGKGVREFAGAYREVVEINQLEMLLPDRCQTAMLEAARVALGQTPLRAFWEAPADAAEQTIGLLAAHNQASGRAPLGFKLRTGGVVPEAFPSSAQIARALRAAAASRVPIKFTAGLHHPVRMYRDEVKTKMHGFLNVLGAGVLASEHAWDEAQIVKMLDDEDPKSFLFDDAEFRWRDCAVAFDKIEQHRAVITSFGSCSFDEPRDDLRALGLL